MDSIIDVTAYNLIYFTANKSQINVILIKQNYRVQDRFIKTSEQVVLIILHLLF